MEPPNINFPSAAIFHPTVLSMPQISFVKPFIDITIFVIILAFTMPLTILELPFISLSIAKDICPIAIEHITLSATKINVFIWI